MELREDYLTGDFVCFSEIRSKRPMDFSLREDEIPDRKDCPFCPENEDIAGELIAVTADGLARSIKNIFPAVEIESGIYGFHEVVVDTSIHDKRPHCFTEREIFASLCLIKDRLASLSSDKKIKYVQVLKNQGVSAGASKSHSHWQIIALPIIPEKQKYMQKALFSYADKHKRCFICELYGRKELIIDENAHWYAAAPYVSRFGYEISLTPLRHVSHFELLSEKELLSLSPLLLASLKRLNILMPGLDYNIYINNSPVNSPGLDAEFSHTSINITPRMGRVAGLELALGGYINPVLSERAAMELRGVNL